MEKRYQIWTKDGLKWCRWFKYSGAKEKWQIAGKQLNEYREISQGSATGIDV